jgi:hypothetical protein
MKQHSKLCFIFALGLQVGQGPVSAAVAILDIKTSASVGAELRLSVVKAIYPMSPGFSCIELMNKFLRR